MARCSRAIGRFAAASRRSAAVPSPSRGRGEAPADRSAETSGSKDLRVGPRPCNRSTSTIGPNVLGTPIPRGDGTCKARYTDDCRKLIGRIFRFTHCLPMALRDDASKPHRRLPLRCRSLRARRPPPQSPVLPLLTLPKSVWRRFVGVRGTRSRQCPQVGVGRRKSCNLS